MSVHPSRRGRPLAAVALAATALLAVGCGGGDDDGGDDRAASGASFDLVIGDIEAYTGDLGAIGEPINRAVRLAAQAASDAAREAGADITVAVETADTESDPQAAVSAARKVVEAGATCLTGPVTTPEATAVLNSVTRVRRIAMLPSASSGQLTTVEDDDTIFRTSPPDGLQARALVAGVEEALGGAEGRTVAFGYQNAPYGEGLAEAFSELWEEKGGAIAGPIGYDPTQSSFDAEAERLVAGSPDAYVIADYPDTFAKLAGPLLRTGDFRADRLFVPDALAVSPIPDSIPSRALEGAYGTRGGTPTGTPEAEAFDQLYRDASGGERATLDAQNFDSGILCFLAAVAAGSADSQEIAERLRDVAGPPGREFTYLELADAVTALRAGEEIDYQGVSGAIDFDEHGDPTAAVYDLFRWQEGEIEVQRQIDAESGAGEGS